MNTMELVVIDGSAFLFRSYFANLRQNLTNNNGFPTGAIFGVINSIKALEKKYFNAKIVLVFDAKGKNHRHKIYPQYKEHRKPTDDDLIMQIEPLYEILQSMSYDFLCINGVEADDTIATIAKQASERKMKTIIASSDKDLYQLINDNTFQLDMNGNLLNHDKVIEKTGVRPDQIVDLLSLSGDQADNIPGIPGVGIKTAAKWLAVYDNIENLKNNSHKISGKIGEKLRNNFANLDLSYKLVQLDYNVNIPDIFSSNPQQNPHKLKKLFALYSFNYWAKELEGNQYNSTTEEANDSLMSNYSQQIIININDFNKLIKNLNSCKYFVFDLETTGLDYMNDTIVGFAFLVGKNSYYLPVAHNYISATKQLNFDEVLSKLKPILLDKKIGKIGQNLKYDSHILANHNIVLNGIIADTMLISYCLNSTATKHNMDDLAEFYLNYKTIHFTDIAGKGRKKLTFDQIEIDKAAKYAIEDVIVTYELFMKLSKKLVKITKLYKLYHQVELPLIKVTAAMERNGVAIDCDKLREQQADIQNRITIISEKIYQIVGYQFNIDSTKQLKQILFDKDRLNIQTSNKTKTGEKSTNEETLKLIDHPVATLLLEYRMLFKLSSTYLQQLPKNINKVTKRLHTSYHQSGTATGRLSSSKPNLQNIPIRTIDGAKIRSAFVANKGYKLVSADYSQMELRIMAHMSMDENLIAAFNDNIDVHKATASLMFGVKLNDVSKEQRSNAKAINFGLIYGMGAFKLAKQINTSKTVAKQYIANYFNSYIKVKEYMDNIKEVAKKQGFVETIAGRRLYLPLINAKNKIAVAHALRVAINAPIQGSGADIIKKSMLAINAWCNNDIKMIMQVHDELVFEIKSDKVDMYINKIKKTMEQIVSLKVPLVVDIGVGDNWQEAH